MAKSVTYPGQHDLGTIVCEALGVDPGEVQRIIIDIPSEGLVRAYVEMIVTNRIFSVDWAAGLKGAEITILDKE